MEVVVQEHDGSYRKVDVPFPLEPYLSLSTFNNADNNWYHKWYKRSPAVSSLIYYNYLTCEVNGLAPEPKVHNKNSNNLPSNKRLGKVK